MQIRALLPWSALPLVATLAAFAPRADARTSEGPAESSIVFASSLSRVGEALTVVYDAPSTGEYTAADLHAFYGTRLLVAADLLTAGVYDLASLFPPDHDFYDSAFVHLSDCAAHMSALGEAWTNGDFDSAEISATKLARSLELAQLADDALDGLGFGRVLGSCVGLATGFQMLGSRRAATEAVLVAAAEAAQLPTDVIAAAVEPVRTIDDPKLLAALHIHSSSEVNELLGAANWLTDPALQTGFSNLGAAPSDFVEDIVAFGLSGHVYALGEGLLDVANEMTSTTAFASGTEDCPDECEEHAECGKCEPSQLSFGTSDRTPKDIENVLEFSAVLLAVNTFAGRGVPGTLMSPLAIEANANALAGINRVLQIFVMRDPKLYTKIRYSCCIDEGCKDFYGWTPFWKTVIRTVCKSYETDWKPCAGDTLHWFELLHGSKKRLLAAMSKAAADVAKTFCPTAC